MDWVIAGILGLVVSRLFVVVYHEITKPSQEDPTLSDFMSKLNESNDE